jgi:hypothetical protein
MEGMGRRRNGACASGYGRGVLCRMKILAPFATTVRELGELRCYRSRTSVKSGQSGGVTWEPWS